MNSSFVVSSFLVLTDRARSVSYWKKQTHGEILRIITGGIQKAYKVSVHSGVRDVFFHF